MGYDLALQSAIRDTFLVSVVATLSLEIRVSEIAHALPA